MDFTNDNSLMGRVQSSVGFLSQFSNCSGTGRDVDPDMASNCLRPVVELRDSRSANFAISLESLGRCRILTVQPR